MTATSTQSLDFSNARSSQDSLRKLFFQIEAELHRSAAFRQALAGVQNQTGSSEGLQALLKAVGREAIRLAMRQMLRATTGKPAASDRSTKRSEKRSEEAAKHVEAVPVSEVSVANDPTPSINTLEPEPITPLVEPIVRRPAPPPISAFEQQRTAALQQIGQALQQARQAKALSIENLHNRTWVPIYQLKALEAGQVEQLPEDIYVRGFIQRAGDALGLNGRELAASLPTPDSAKTVIPSWSRSRPGASATDTYLQPMHLYVGYAALMAGAVGGLAWISQHPIAPGLLHQLEPSDSEPQSPELQRRPGTRFSSNTTRVAVAQAIAQPEATTPEAKAL